MEKINPLVTVIMPTYNRAHLILESLNSVINQTYAHWECIIVDDGSTDGTEQLLHPIVEKDNRIKYFKKENGGAAAARNYGIAKSRGVYILPLDSDDLIAVTYIEKAVTQFQIHPKLKIVYSQASKFGTEEGKWLLPKFSYPLFLVYNMIFNSSMYKRTDFEHVGGYDEQNMLEDWDFWIKILKSGGEVYQIPETMYFYRTHERGSVTTLLSKNKELYKKSMDQLFKNHIDEYLQYIGNPIELEREHRALSSEVKKADYKLAKRIMDAQVFKLIRSIPRLWKTKKP